MFDLTTLDYIYLGVVLASTIWATIRGGVYETVATISWVVAAVAARFASPLLDGLFQSWFKLSESTIGTLVSSYFLVFFVILVVFGFFNHKLRDKIQESMMKVTDHTLGVIFGIIRGIVLMGLVYWCALWYYSDAPKLPHYVATSRTRPVMQLTAVKLHDWFIPGESKLLDRDMTGT
ncbi:MAG: CvpA family protein, partial [Rickettsiales bacterium]|nr:CvpA family protein [Rickettsiales bacterium]